MLDPQQVRAELIKRGDWTEDRERQFQEKYGSEKESLSPMRVRDELIRRGDWNEDREQQFQAKYGSKEEESPWQYAKRRVAMGAKDVAAGLGGGLDLPLLPLRAAANYGAKKAGYDLNLPSLQSAINEGIDVATSGYTKPRTKNEALMSTITQELAGLPTGFGVGTLAAKHLTKNAPHKVAKFVQEAHRPTATNIGGTAGAAGALHKYHEDNENPSLVGSLGVGLLGGLGGAGLGQAIRHPHQFGEALANARAKAVGKMSGFDKEAYAANKAADIESTLGSVSEGALPQSLETILGHMPFSSKSMRDFHSKRGHQVASKLGFGEAPFQEIPGLTEKTLARWGAEKLQQGKSDEYKALEKVFNPLVHRLKEERHMVDVKDLIGELRAKGIGLTNPGEIDMFAKTVPGHFLMDLYGQIGQNKSVVKQIKKGDYSGKVLKDVLENIENDPKISYASLDLLRKNMQDKMLSYPSGSHQRNDAAGIYNYLASRRYKTISDVGSPEELAAFREAKGDWAKYANEKASMLQNKEVGPKAASYKLTDAHDAQAFNMLTSKDPIYLRAVRMGLNADEREKLALSMISNMGTRDGMFNLSAFYNKYKDMEPATKNEFMKLFSNESAKKGFEEAVDFLQANKKKLDAITNSSFTAHKTQEIEMWKSFAQHLKNIGVGVVATAGVGTVAGVNDLTSGVNGLLTLGATLGGGKYMAKLMTDQAFLDRIYKVSTAKTPKAQKNYYNLLLKTPTVKAMLKDASSGSAIMEGKKQEEERHKPLKVKVTRPERVY